MADTVMMPKLGFDMKEGTLVRWVKQVNDTVNVGDVIAEIETDKATVEVEAYASGILRKWLVNENTIVEVGAPIAIIGTADEPIEGGSAPAASAAPASQTTVSASPAPAASAPKAANGHTASAPISDEGYPGGVKASPVARRMAEEKGINLAQVSGTGPGGRVVKRDIEGFTPGVEAPAAPTVAATPAPTQAPAPTFGSAPTGADIEEIPLTRMRKIVGERTQASFQFVPHFFVTSEIDMGPALALRKQLNAGLTEEQKITVNDLVVKAAALALREFPNLNTHFYGDKLVRHKRINIGIAVAVENGLINVVCKDADRRTLTDMSVKNKEMIAGAREGKVKPDDVEGATFTVSNLGAYDVEHFLAIINPPEAAILAVGSALEVPIVENGEIKIGVRMKATVSVDHRVSDGAEGAQYLQRVKELLENPMRLLI
ncbi:MAG: dihydrolipoamide acetyltransferase component of pyruvate dehydrogenase complex [Chloroflexota bacterium]|nr:2-oxo acid dehydrogenase subunit E2 [Chloroflexota bacterium]NOG66173.1 2-oxo acid dehydrogenase subunit E2 [Chloroflexota bacterium]GIK67659.1 MAG: dihydrolipoamide acetyltransferase component of pyruvate dehydrogenase complex [Chloroflexota bacterium]